MGSGDTSVLVTGAGGFIGASLVRALAAEGYRVRASDLPQVDLRWARDLGAEIVPSALEDAPSIDRAVAGCARVVHAAAIFDLSVDAATIRRVNVEGTERFCEAAVRHGVKRLVLFSTAGVYGVPQDKPAREDSPKRPRNAYETSKWESEQVAMRYHRERGLAVTALRPTLVYGPGSKYGQAMYLALFSLLRYWGLRRLPIPAGGKLTHHVHVDDVVAAALTLLEADGVAGRAFNVADDTPIDAEAALRFYCDSVGITLTRLPAALQPALGPALRYGPRLFAGRLARLNAAMERTWPRLVGEAGLAPVLRPRLDAGWFDYLWADHVYATDALRGLGWRPRRSFHEGIAETLAWYRAQRWLPTKEFLQRTPRPATQGASHV